MASMERFLAEEDGPKLIGQSLQGQKPPPPLPICTKTPPPGLPLKGQPAIPYRTSDEESTNPSISHSPSILSRRESESSTVSTIPSDGADSVVGNLGTMSIRGQQHNLPCLLREIIGCSVTFRASERGPWSSHALSHYGAFGPPAHALCIFCHTVFDSNDPTTCWSNRMEHIADHFENGWTIERSRPDFRVLEDMRNKGCISEDDFQHCFRYTERPACDGLKPHDFIPDEIKEKQRLAYDKLNRVIITESRQEARDRIRGKPPAIVGSKKSKSKSKAILK